MSVSRSGWKRPILGTTTTLSLFFPEIPEAENPPLPGAFLKHWPKPKRSTLLTSASKTWRRIRKSTISRPSFSEIHPYRCPVATSLFRSFQRASLWFSYSMDSMNMQREDLRAKRQHGVSWDPYFDTDSVAAKPPSQPESSSLQGPHCFEI